MKKAQKKDTKKSNREEPSTGKLFWEASYCTKPQKRHNKGTLLNS